MHEALAIAAWRGLFTVLREPFWFYKTSRHIWRSSGLRWSEIILQVVSVATVVRVACFWWSGGHRAQLVIFKLIIVEILTYFVALGSWPAEESDIWPSKLLTCSTKWNRQQNNFDTCGRNIYQPPTPPSLPSVISILIITFHSPFYSPAKYFLKYPAL